MDVSLIDPRQPASQQLGKYRLVATLGQGGMGTVYLALATGVGKFRKLLVVKELLPDLTRKPGFIEMFLDEARLAARLEHPNVVQTFEAGNEGGRYFLAMEYLDGQPFSALLDRLRERGGLPTPMHIHILCEVLAGLQYAHSLRDYDGSPLHVVHRDVSPQNVFITYHGQVKVVDFGVAKAATASALTSPGVFKGKFGYAAPEQVLGRPVDARSDVFAVGVMLWQSLSGLRFSEPMPTPESFRARTTGAEPRILQVAPQTDPLLAEICDSALMVDPERRLHSAQEFYDELVHYQIVTRSRIDPGELGDLMRDVFANERRAVHQVLELAMKQEGASPSVVEALPFLQSEGEKVLTSRADLSRLVQVSHASDDDEIREQYARSMAAPIPAPLASPPPPRPRRRFGRISSALSRSLALAAAVFSVCLVAWVSVRLFGGTAPERSVNASRVPPTQAAPAAPKPTAPTPPLPAAAAPVREAAAPAASVEEPTPKPPAATAGEETTPAVQRFVRRRAAAHSANDVPDEAPPVSAPHRSDAAASRPASSTQDTRRPETRPTDVEMGSDLGPIRRQERRLRIDVEDPYQ